MKIKLILISFVFLISIGCKKNYTCSCGYPNGTTTEVHLHETPNQAKQQCEPKYCDLKEN